jgi:hypothetical protein
MFQFAHIVTIMTVCFTLVAKLKLHTFLIAAAGWLNLFY